MEEVLRKASLQGMKWLICLIGAIRDKDEYVESVDSVDSESFEVKRLIIKH